MDELLNCPFCGGEAEATENYEHSDYVAIDGFIVFCKKCGNGTDTYCLKKDAIAAWNRRADGWIPVAERLPDYDCVVLAYGIDGSVMDAMYWTDMRGNGYWAHHAMPVTVTHWMPLPEPPKKGE